MDERHFEETAARDEDGVHTWKSGVVGKMDLSVKKRGTDVVSESGSCSSGTCAIQYCIQEYCIFVLVCTHKSTLDM